MDFFLIFEILFLQIGKNNSHVIGSSDEENIPEVSLSYVLNICNKQRVLGVL